MPIKILLIFLSFLLLACLVYSLIEPFFIEEKTFKIKNKQIPDSLNGKRAVFLSDIHHSLYFSEKRLKSLIKKVNSLNPDLVLLGGDYADGGKEHLDKAASLLSNLKPKLSKPIGVLGNHDHGLGKEACLKAFSKNDLPLLVDDNFILAGKNKERKTVIAGIDDLHSSSPSLKKALKGTKKEDFVILLSHSPDISEKMKKPQSERVDLVLSGHTHGGQINFFGLWAPVTMSEYGQKYLSGPVNTPFGKTITSRGIGTVILPMRFFARPQIMILEFSSPEAIVKIGKKTIKAELASSEKELKKGLMNRDELCDECGMLFVLKQDKKHAFWMKNTLIGLDILFIDKNKKVVDIKKADPCRKKQCPVYKPSQKCRYVLEVPAGTFDRSVIGNNINIEINQQ